MTTVDGSNTGDVCTLVVGAGAGGADGAWYVEAEVEERGVVRVLVTADIEAVWLAEVVWVRLAPPRVRLVADDSAAAVVKCPPGVVATFDVATSDVTPGSGGAVATTGVAIVVPAILGAAVLLPPETTRAAATGSAVSSPLPMCRLSR